MTDIPFAMPDPRELSGATPVAGNHAYVDLRGATWDEVEDALRQDREIAPRLRASDDPEEELLDYAAEKLGVDLRDKVARFDALESSIYRHLDPGLASTVLGLSAAGAAPTYSCNGGIFGDRHHELFPLVCFYAPTHIGERVATLAHEAGVVLEFNSISNTPVLSCLQIEPFMRFAELMIVEFRSLARINDQ
jgi:hypothetical protein